MQAVSQISEALKRWKQQDLVSRIDVTVRNGKLLK